MELIKTVTACWAFFNPKNTRCPPLVRGIHEVRAAAEAFKDLYEGTVTTPTRAMQIIKWIEACDLAYRNIAIPRHLDMAIVAQLLSWVGESLDEMREAHAERTRRGRAVSRDGARRLTMLETLHDALVTYDRSLHEFAGDAGASMEATALGDVLAQQLRD